MRLYIAGPVTGLADGNYPAFEYAAKRLFDAGHLPVLPPELRTALLPTAEMSLGQCYRKVIPADIVELATCDGMIVLPGFERSHGTAFELHGAELFDMEVFRPAYTSDEFPGGLSEWMDVILDMIDVHVAMRVEA